VSQQPGWAPHSQESWPPPDYGPPDRARGGPSKSVVIAIVIAVLTAVNGPTEAINGRLEHLRGSALGFRNLTNQLHRQVPARDRRLQASSVTGVRARDGVGRTREPTEEQLEAALDVD
jgi:Transposase